MAREVFTPVRLSDDGRGIAQADGKVVFVRGALPGETVEAERVVAHRRFDEAELLAVLEAARERVTPPCPRYGECGGCDLQHLALSAQRDHKVAVLTQALRRAKVDPLPTVAAPDAALSGLTYRRRARFSVHWGRGGRLTLGFREAKGHRIVGLRQCPILVPALTEVPGQLQDALEGLALGPWLTHVDAVADEAGTGGWCRLAFRGRRGEAVPPLEAEDRARLEGLAQSLDRPVLADLSGTLETFGGAAPELREGGVTYAPGAFLQANGAVNAALRAAVLSAVGAPTGAPVLDAFAGAGNFAWALAEAGHEVLAVEGDGRALRGLKQRAESAGLNLKAQPLDLFNELPLKLGQFETVVLDPPRAGADHLCKGLAALRKGRRPKRIVYVSCAPPTLARDAALLSGAGYALRRAAVFDMFPQTHHVECLAVFEG